MTTGNIVHAELHITGTRPLLFHAFGLDAIPANGRKEREGAAGNNPNEWRKTVLVLSTTRQLYLKPTYLFGSLRDGAQHTPRKRSTLQKYVAATLQILDEIILLDRYLPPEPLPTDADQPVYLDIQSVKNPSTRARNVRYRVAVAPGWTCRCRLSWDKTVVSTAEMEAVAHDAGRLCGVGDGRGVGYGRYAVASFTVGTADRLVA
jgi:hypothetical protein